MPVAAVKINLADNTLAGNSAAVVAALTAAGLGGTQVAHPLGDSLSGSITLDRANGARQKGALNGDITVDVTGGSEGDTLTFLVKYATGVQITLGSSVKLPPSALANTFTLDAAWEAWAFDFERLGSSAWNLVSFRGAYFENED